MAQPSQRDFQKKASPSPVAALSQAMAPRPFAPQADVAAPDVQARDVATPDALTLDSAPAFPNLNFQIRAAGGSPPPLQPKLTIGAPNDKYEQEADRVAAQVVQRIHSPAANLPTEKRAYQAQSVQRQAWPEQPVLQMQPTLQRETLPDEDDELQMKPMIQRLEMAEDDELQMKPMPQRSAMPPGVKLQMKSASSEGVVEGNASPDLEAGIQQARGNGQALVPHLQIQIGQAMGADFSGVRVHTDTQSDQFNRSIQAKAFTTGQDIFFRQGAYQPGSQSGQELIAHELTHVVQQNGQSVQRKSTMSPLNQQDPTADKVSSDFTEHQIIQSQSEEAEITNTYRDQITKTIPPTSVASRQLLVQRALPTLKQWKKSSKIAGARIDWRSTEMKAIGTTLNTYNKTNYLNPQLRMNGLLNILKAISAWQLKKDRDAGENIPVLKGTSMVPKTNSQTPQAHETRGRSVAVNSLLDEIKLEIHRVLSFEQTDWDESNFTDPAQHDKDKFKYLVNGVQEYDKEPEYITTMLQDPSLLKNALMSISFITNDKTPLWCPSGFIVKVPKENIVAARNEDAASESAVSQYHSVEIYKEVARLFVNVGMQAPSELIEKTKQDPIISKHNEIVALGQGATGKTTEVAGIFIVENPAKPKTPIDVAYELTDEELGGRLPTIEVSPKKYKRVAKKQPGVSKARMDIYEQTAKDKQLSIIYIPMAKNADFSTTRYKAWSDAKYIEYGDPLVKEKWGL